MPYPWDDEAAAQAGQPQLPTSPYAYSRDPRAVLRQLGYPEDLWEQAAPPPIDYYANQQAQAQAPAEPGLLSRGWDALTNAVGFATAPLHWAQHYTVEPVYRKLVETLAPSEQMLPGEEIGAYIKRRQLPVSEGGGYKSILTGEQEPGLTERAGQAGLPSWGQAGMREVLSQAAQMGSDPTLLAMGPIAGASEAALANAGRAAKIAGQLGPGVEEFAPELATWGKNATGALAEALNSPIRRYVMPYVHRGYQAGMALGGVEATKDLAEAVAKGDWNRAAEAAVNAGMSIGGLAYPEYLKLKEQAAVGHAYDQGRTPEQEAVALGDQAGPQEPQPAPQPVPEPTPQPQSPPPATPTASAPAFIPRNVEQALADLGYSAEQRRAMKPEEAQQILAEQRRATPEAAAPLSDLVSGRVEELKQARDSAWEKIASLPGFPAHDPSMLARTHWAEKAAPELYSQWLDASRAVGEHIGGVNAPTPPPTPELVANPVADSAGNKYFRITTSAGDFVTNVFGDKAASEETALAEAQRRMQMTQRPVGEQTTLHPLSHEMSPAYQVGPGKREVGPAEKVVVGEVAGAPAPTPSASAMRDLLLRLYPDNSYIKENSDGTYVVDLPGGRTVLLRPAADHIDVSTSRVAETHGQEAVGSTRVVGATWPLPHSAIVHVLSDIPNQVKVAVHEHWHVMRHLGNLSDAELGALEHAYPSIEGGKTSEERQADAFADWLTRQQPKTGMSTLFERVLDGLRAVRDFIRRPPEQPPLTPEQKAEAVFQRAHETGLAEEAPSEPQATAATAPTTMTSMTTGGRAPGQAAGTQATAVAPAVQGRAAARPLAPVPTRQPGDFISPDDQRRHLNTHLAAFNLEGGKRRAGAGYISPPKQENTLRLERGGKPFFTGPLSNEDWLQKATAWVGQPGSPAWRTARNWYRDLLGEFTRVYGPEDGEKMLRLWGITQQRASPSAGLANLLRAEDVVRGFRPEEGVAKAGLAHDRLLAALRNEPTSLGQKLADFTDAIHGDSTRQWVGHDPRGGQPAPVDVHAAREVGFVDKPVVNRVRKLFGDKTADKLKPDLKAAPTPQQYFAGHEFYNKLADFLNERGIDGGGWSPAEAQAVGWTAQQNMMGSHPESAAHIFPRSIAHIAVEAAPGEGAPRNTAWAAIPEDKRAEVAYHHIQDIAPEAARLAGVRLLKTVETSGVWEQYQNPNVVFEALNPDAALRFAKLMARAAQQTEVWVQRVSPKSTANAIGVDIWSPQGYDFGKQGDAVRFWNDALAHEPGLRASVVASEDGTPILRVIANTRATAQRVVSALDRWSGKAEYDLSLIEVSKTVNDWRTDDSGAAHTQDLRGVEAGALDTFLRHAEESFSKRAADAGAPAEAAPAEPAAVAPAASAAPGAGGGAVEPEALGEAARAAVGPLPGQPPAAAPAGAASAPAPPPLDTGRATGNPPRVEENLRALHEAMDEQHRLGIPDSAPPLDRDTRQLWSALDPEIRHVIATRTDDEWFKLLKKRDRNLSAAETQALDAVTRGRKEAKDSALIDYMAAKGSPAEAEAFHVYSRALADFLAFDRGYLNDGTGLSRALAARNRIMAAAQLPPDRAMLRQIMKEFKGISDSDADRLVSMWETGDPQFANAIRAQMAGNWGKFWTLYRANLIGIPSEFAKGFGDTISGFLGVADRAAAAASDYGLSKLFGTKNRERYLAETPAEIQGSLKAIPSALSTYFRQRLIEVYRSAWTGEPLKAVTPGAKLSHQISPFKSKLPRLLATSLDNMRILSDAFEQIHSGGILRAHATRLAIQRTGESFTPKMIAEAERLQADILNYPERYPETVNAIRSEALRRVFRDPNKLVDDLQQFASKHQWLHGIIPFMRTTANITRSALRHSPTGLVGMLINKNHEINVAIRDFKANKISQGELADVIAPRVTGTLVTAAVLGLAQSGLITGQGPTDPNQRRALLATGWQPYSMVFTGKDGRKTWVPYNRFEPISQVVGTAADIYELRNAKDAQDASTQLVATITHNLIDRSFLRGMMDFGNTLSDPQGHLSTWMSNIAGAITPATVDKLAFAIDPYYRDVRPEDRGFLGLPEKIKNTLESQIPGVSSQLPPRYTPTGEPAMRPGEGLGGAIERFLLPTIPTSEHPGTQLEALIGKVGGAGSPQTAVTVQGVSVPLQREEKDLFVTADQKAANELRRTMSSPGFQRLPDTEDEGGSQSKQAMIREVFSKYRADARARLLRSASFRSRARDTVEQFRAAHKETSV